MPETIARATSVWYSWSMKFAATNYCNVLLAGLVVLVLGQWDEPRDVIPGIVGAAEPPVGLQCLVDAYPDHLDRAVLDDKGNWQLLWKDGELMPWDDGRKDKTYDDKLNHADLQDQMSIRYPAGREYLPLAANYDPGRIRFEPFFKKLYGDSAKAAAANLVEIRWLPKTVNRKIRPTQVNGVHQKLAAVSAMLEKLPPELMKFARETSGPFNWRFIKGTKRLSSHSFGSAIDIGVEYSNYWRWSKPDKHGLYPYKNRIPLEIVEVFERQGFIWGGKWYRYDTMHFEYRPELLDQRCAK